MSSAAAAASSAAAAAASFSVAVDSARRLIRFTPKARASASVILIHGLGDSASGWADVGRMIAASMPHVRVTLPTAPRQPVTINGGAECNSWYDIESLTDRDDQPCAGIDKSRAAIEQIIEEERAAGVLPERLVVGGFSQGGALSLYTGLQSKVRLAGVLCMSGYFANRRGFTLSDENKDTPVLMCHGDRDAVVPHSGGRASFEALRAMGVSSIEFKTYRGMAHSACEEELSDVFDWLRRVIPPPVSA
jgi:lysophospholipase-2